MYLNGVQNKEVPMLIITPEVLKDLKNGNITVGLEHTRDFKIALSWLKEIDEDSGKIKIYNLEQCGDVGDVKK